MHVHAHMGHTAEDHAFGILSVEPRLAWSWPTSITDFNEMEITESYASYVLLLFDSFRVGCLQFTNEHEQSLVLRVRLGAQVVATCQQRQIEVAPSIRK